MHRCPVAAWEGWTTKHDLREDSEWAAAGNCWAAQSYSATERGINVPRASVQALTRPATSHPTLLTDWRSGSPATRLRPLLRCMSRVMAHGRRSSPLQRDCLLSGGYPTRQRGSSEPPAAVESDPRPETLAEAEYDAEYDRPRDEARHVTRGSGETE